MRTLAVTAVLLASSFVGLPTSVAAAQPSCASDTRSTGTLTVCPAAAPVGSTVTVSGKGCHTTGSAEITAVFLGPRAYVGSAGGGAEFSIPVHGRRFSTTFTIPRTYRAGGDTATAVHVTPGSSYRFALYPAALCTVPFTVTGTAATPPLADTGPARPVGALLALGLALLAAGGAITRTGRRRTARAVAD